MKTRNIAIVILDEGHAVTSVRIMDNVTLDWFKLYPVEMPKYLEERIALLRLGTVNKATDISGLGKWFSETEMHIPMTYDEYYDLKNKDADDSREES
jgi:hypothetical protein